MLLIAVNIHFYFHLPFFLFFLLLPLTLSLFLIPFVTVKCCYILPCRSSVVTLHYLFHDFYPFRYFPTHSPHFVFLLHPLHSFCSIFTLLLSCLYLAYVLSRLFSLFLPFLLFLLSRLPLPCLSSTCSLYPPLPLNCFLSTLLFLSTFSAHFFFTLPLALLCSLFLFFPSSFPFLLVCCLSFPSIPQ